MGRVFTVFAIVGLATSFCSSAWADCHPLSVVTSVDLTPADNKLAEFVPVTINGVPKYMLLDTGGAYAEITGDAADELKLARRKGNFELYNVSGKFSDEFTSASLTIGNLKADDAVFVISPGSNMFSKDSKVAGILGPDILQHYDVHLDFGANKLTILSQDHCEGKVIYWTAGTVAVVPMRVLQSGHILFPVLLDGVSMNALLDTGAANTTLTIPAEERGFNFKLGSADTPIMDVMPDRPGAYIYKHTFKTLDFEGVAVGNLTVQIIPDALTKVTANTPELGTRLADRKKDEDKADMLVGMDVLRHFHVYIAYKEQKLYITPVEAPPAAEGR
jgi:hypothetical protein